MINCYAVVLGSLCVAVHRSLTARHLRTGVLGWLAVALALGVAISAVQTAPLYEFARLARRWVGAPEAIRWGQRVPYSVPAQYSLSWKGLAGILVPAATPEAHTTAFLGLTIIVLAVLGILYRWCDRSVRIASYLGLGAALYAMGATTPVHKFLYTVLPMLDMARHPVRGLFLVTFAVSLLAASGAEWLLSTPTARSRRAGPWRYRACRGAARSGPAFRLSSGNVPGDPFPVLPESTFFGCGSMSVRPVEGSPGSLAPSLWRGAAFAGRGPNSVRSVACEWPCPIKRTAFARRPYSTTED